MMRLENDELGQVSAYRCSEYHLNISMKIETTYAFDVGYVWVCVVMRTSSSKEETFHLF